MLFPRAWVIADARISFMTLQCLTLRIILIENMQDLLGKKKTLITELQKVDSCQCLWSFREISRYKENPSLIKSNALSTSARGALM